MDVEKKRGAFADGDFILGRRTGGAYTSLRTKYLSDGWMVFSQEQEKDAVMCRFQGDFENANEERRTHRCLGSRF